MKIREILERIVKISKSEREKGTRFENLINLFLRHDKTFAPQFSKIYTYAEWAKERDEAKTDIGIDLVAKNADNEFFTAIQCKFYAYDAHLAKSGIDSFISASERKEFDRRVFVYTTKSDITANAQKVIDKSTKTFTRIGLEKLEESSIDWDTYIKKGLIEQKPYKQIRLHQQEALSAMTKGFKKADRGKMIMACGTGKTFTALKIGEKMAAAGGNILFLTPSLSLVDQALKEWTQESKVKLNSFAVCSDTEIGKHKASAKILSKTTMQKKNAKEKQEKEEGDTGTKHYDLACPATTDFIKLSKAYKESKLKHPKNMNVIFGTYHSIDVISQAQKKRGLPEFDLIICDEAHRTVGHTKEDKKNSPFIRVHHQANIKGKKRLYMTATPRIYSEKAKGQASEKNLDVFSMDEISLYGEELYVMKFGDAVENGLLSDYKVVILHVDENYIAENYQSLLADNEELDVDMAGKIIGCYKALLKRGIEDTENTNPMKKAVMFCKEIKESKSYSASFAQAVDKYKEIHPKDLEGIKFNCDTHHVDGTMNAAMRSEEIRWLERANENNGRILSNAKCLNEGVNIPSLDAIMFMNTKKSKVDIVQAVGRVMRVAKDKRLGYVILPVVLPSRTDDQTIEDVLDDSKKYDVVWDVLNALRSHDERLDADINKMGMGKLPSKIEVVSVVGSLWGEGSDDKDDDDTPRHEPPEQPPLPFDVRQAIFAKIVKTCGTRGYLKLWVNSVVEVAHKEIVRINGLLADENSKASKAFAAFLIELQKNINSSITKDEAVEMLAQHIITKPIFDGLFKDYDFSQNNPVSKAMQGIIEVLQKNNTESETKSLSGFYKSIQRRIDGINEDSQKQKILNEIYDDFFKKAFSKMTERLGIVYTPVECVDFIIHSVNDVLKQEFNQSLGEPNTHIIDPFTGTGTFITRLLQSGLIDEKQLPHKYKNELHANEIVLMAYYMASINIESAYHDVMQRNATNKNIQYEPFNGICLTDTFQLYEDKADLLTPQFPDNSKRISRQKKLKDIRVIIGNPPYSAKQKSGNDNNQNLVYSKLDESIKESYVKQSRQKGLKSNLYDSYIRAVRWASDRLGDKGVIAYITNGGWIESNSADGMRKALAEEFSRIYIFHLRGNQRTSGELSKKEGGKIFGIGSRAPIAITLFVKNPNATKSEIYFYDIGDYLTRTQKLSKVKELGHIAGINNKFNLIKPNDHYDWINQRDHSFYNHIAMGSKKTTESAIFKNYSLGLATNRDTWVYNASENKLKANIKKTIHFYNSELDRYNQSKAKQKQPSNKKEAEKYIANFVNSDSQKIAFSTDFRDAIYANIKKKFIKSNVVDSLYRPYTKTKVYYSKSMMTRLYQMPKIFPEAGLDNLVIGVSGKAANSFSCLISNHLADLNVLKAGYQCFPLKLYEAVDNPNENNLFAESDADANIVTADSGKQYQVTEAITAEGLEHFTKFYKSNKIKKEDLFYYIYGLLHSPDYRQRFSSNLSKDLPHIPRVKKINDFWLFSKAGRALADLHLNYENKKPFRFEQGQLLQKLSDDDHYVKKMKFKKKKIPSDKKGQKTTSIADKTTIIYNDEITIPNIPLKAYDYVVNSKPAIEWVMERQSISTHKESGIQNNANDFALETRNNPRYPLELLLKVITISVDSVKIIESLPKLDF